MDYIELQITLSPYEEELAECLSAELGDLGYEGFATTDTGLNAYIPVPQYDEKAVKLLFYLYGKSAEITYTPQFIAEQNWNAVWEANFQPIIIANRCTVRAPFHKNLPKTELTLVITPKMAFGTGHHDTTYLMAEALLNFPVKNLQVLDMGCGTGILAMIAAKRGAKQFVDAIDIDVWSKNSTLENARRNRVGHKIRAILGDASLIQRDKYDLILANINRNILLADLRTYALGLKPGGTLFLSGFFPSDCPDLEAEALRHHFAKISETSRNNWAMMQFRKGQ
jgi:ribosomal protein L11 methyltransferase